MSAITLIIKDGTFGGKVLNEISIYLAGETVRVRDIIEARVFAEVEKYNARLDGFYNGLIQPVDAEVALNGYKMKTKNKVDPEKQAYVAFNAFVKNGFFILIDNIQSQDLDEIVLVNEQTSISFVKLTPLIGG